MLININNSEIMTIEEFRQKYADKWFYYVIVEKEGEWMYKQSSEIKAKVLFLADSKKELVKLPSNECRIDEFGSGGIEWGVMVNPEPGLSIGGLYIEQL